MLVQGCAVRPGFLAGMPFVCLHRRDGDARNPTPNKSVFFEKKMFVEVGFNIGAIAGEVQWRFSLTWSTMLSSLSYICKVALGVLCCCSQGQLWGMVGCVCVQTVYSSVQQKHLWALPLSHNDLKRH